MTRSMTAFARSEQDLDGNQLIWEVRSVNHRYLDVHLRLPEDFRSLEPRCRKLIGECMSRGRVDAHLKHGRSPGAISKINIDTGAVESLVAAMKTIEQAHPQLGPARTPDILGWPGVIIEPPMDRDTVSRNSIQLLQETLAALVESRDREGACMAKAVRDRVTQSQEIVYSLSEKMPEIQQKNQEKWQNRVEELGEERLAQEIVVLLTKSDISEELDRLQTHLCEVVRLLGEEKPVGRSLDFLMQELNREANTLGAKSIDQEMTNASIELKVLVEQMREQVQNIE